MRDVGFSPQQIESIIHDQQVSYHGLHENSALVNESPLPVIKERIQKVFETQLSRALWVAKSEECSVLISLGLGISKAMEDELSAPNTLSRLEGRLFGHEKIMLWCALQTDVGSTLSLEAISELAQQAHRKVELSRTRNKEALFDAAGVLPPVGLEVEFQVPSIFKDSYALGTFRRLAGYKEGTNTGGSSHEVFGLARGLNILDSRNARYYVESDIRKHRPFREFAHEPTASPTTQLREHLALRVLDERAFEKVNIHTNIGDMLMSSEHPEPAYILAAMAAAGYSDTRDFANADALFDGIPKISAYVSVDEEYGDDREVVYAYCPGIKTRAYIKYDSSRGYYAHYVTEYRMLGEYSNFSDMVKGVETTYWLSVAARAHQKIEGGMPFIPRSGLESVEDTNDFDDKLIALSELWENFVTDFQRLSSSHRIRLSDELVSNSIAQATKDFKEHDYYNLDNVHSRPPINTPYNRALAQLVRESHSDLNFRKSVRHLTIKYRGLIRKLAFDENQEAQEEIDSLV